MKREMFVNFRDPLITEELTFLTTEKSEMPPYNITGQQIFEHLARVVADEMDRRSRFTRKGDKRLLVDIERQKAGIRRARKAKQDAAAERLAAEQKARRAAAAHKGGSVSERMLKAMEPGKWYGRGDLMRLAETDRNNRSNVHQVLKTKGWIEKARNPAWTGERLNPWLIQAGAEPEPQWLYRLTAIGQAHRDGLLNR
jgi:hypothetical protein